MYGIGLYIPSPNYDDIFTPPGPVYTQFDEVRTGQDDRNDSPQLTRFCIAYHGLVTDPSSGGILVSGISKKHGLMDEKQDSESCRTNPLTACCDELLEDKGNDSIRSHRVATEPAVDLNAHRSRREALFHTFSAYG